VPPDQPADAAPTQAPMARSVAVVEWEEVTLEQQQRQRRVLVLEHSPQQRECRICPPLERRRHAMVGEVEVGGCGQIRFASVLSVRADPASLQQVARDRVGFEGEDPLVLVG